MFEEDEYMEDDVAMRRDQSSFLPDSAVHGGANRTVRQAELVDVRSCRNAKSLAISHSQMRTDGAYFGWYCVGPISVTPEGQR